METTTSQTSATLGIKEALSLLDKISGERTYSCWVPSVSAEVFFTEVTAGQQKELLKAVVDSPFYRSKFIIASYEILQKNIRSPFSSFRLKDLTIIDKQLMLLKMRAECFDSQYEINDPNAPRPVDLNYVYETAKQNITNIGPEVITEGQIALHVRVPSMETDYKLEKELHENIDVMSINDAVALRTVLGDLFISEISKYVISVDINGKSIDLTSLSFRSRIELLEKLSTTSIQKVTTYIDSVKRMIDSITTVEIPIKDSEKTFKDTFAIDGTFFVTSK